MWLAWITIALIASRAGGRENPRTFCGRNLADARTLYCMGTEAGRGEMQQKKRDVSPFEAAWPWPPRVLHARTQLRSRSRDKRVPGLVDECCLKPCYLDELLSYC